MKDEDLLNFKALKESFKMVHESMAADFSAIGRDMDELHSIINYTRTSKAILVSFPIVILEELKRIILSCKEPILRFEGLLSIFWKEKIELNQLDFSPFM